MTAGLVLPAAVVLSGGKAVGKVRTDSTQRCTLGVRGNPVFNFTLLKCHCEERSDEAILNIAVRQIATA
jgi:hypothetical protein